MNINFFMPTKVIMENNAVLNNADLFLKYGKKALIVTGKHSAEVNGSLEDTVKALNKSNIQYVVFNEVEENPSLETIEKATDIGRDFGCEFIIGIGGGSPLDASKAIAVMMKNPEITKENIFTSGKLAALDVIAIPTTSGTGSETTQYSIVTVHKEKTKMNLGQEVFPKVALLDAKYTEFMPVKTTISTAVDAFSHLVESYLNKNANILTDGVIEKALVIWGKAIPALLKGEFSYTDRENLMIASTMAGMVIAQTGTSLPHGMGYPLTYFKNMPHGLANGCLYKEYLAVFKDRKKIDNIWALLGLKSYEEMIEILSALTKVDIEITEEEIKDYTDSMWNNKSKLKNHPEEVSFEEIYNIYYNTFKNS